MQPYTVLVVEDDPILRLDAVVLFEEAGFAVHEFETADDAADYVRARPRSIGAVFTDINLPGHIDGIALASMISDRWPDITVLATSGACVEKPPALPPQVSFIPKPWLPLDLLVAMQQAAGTA